MTRQPDARPITLLLCALGGEGGGVLSEWLYELAVRCGHAAQSTSIPGVAQRTGATTYYVEVCPLPDAQLAGRRPVFSLNPVPGAIDGLVSSELLETVRQIGNGMASAARTTVLSSTARALTVAEKMQMADGRLDDAALVATLQRHAKNAELLDMAALAREAGCAISAVLFGCIAGSGLLPFPRDAFEATIRAGGRGVEPSLRGFALAFERIAQRREQQAQVGAALQPPDLRALARQRLLDYQDAAYVGLYDERLARVEAAETSVSGRAGAITAEVTRWLALWMAFDDIVRVAALKLSASRRTRVRREVAARDDEIVKTFEHFKPGVPEIAGLLPAGLARQALAWDAQRVAAGGEAWSLPLRIGTHTVVGALMLRAVAAMKGQRRRGSRYALEQSLIERWLAAVERGTREDAALGLEIAYCGRLIKGYGSTNERGKEKLLHVIDHLAFAAGPASRRASAVAAAREAALADDGGRAFDIALQAHGAAPRTVQAQPLRFYRRRPAP
jgi:indolepyruvate ferredoxin oxidoreductase beta subunit